MAEQQEPGPAPDAADLSREKLALECALLRAELAQTALAWWKRPAYIAAMVPIVIATLGFVSAWLTGYFNTERENLRIEIAALEAKRDAIQSEIDHAYLTLKVAVAEARYAVGHFEGMPGLEAGDVQDLDDFMARPRSEQQAVLRDLIALRADVRVIATISRDELDQLQSSLAAVPASGWAVALTPTLEPAHGTILVDPGGRHYDIENKRFSRPKGD